MENFIIEMKNILHIPDNSRIPTTFELPITWKIVQCSLSKMSK